VSTRTESKKDLFAVEEQETERSKVTTEANMRRQNLMLQMKWSPYADPRN
jgi:hypothetical protein